MIKALRFLGLTTTEGAKPSSYSATGFVVVAAVMIAACFTPLLVLV